MVTIQTIQTIESILMIIMYSLLSIFILFILSFVVFSHNISKAKEKKYKTAIIKMILSDSPMAEESINAMYTDYKTRSRFSFLSFDEINSRLIADLRDNSYTKYYQPQTEISESEIRKFEKIIKKITENLMFSDKKISNIIDLLEKSKIEHTTKKNLHDSILICYNSVLSYCDGRIFEKNQEISRQKLVIENLKKKKWIIRIISGILSIIGLISSIITIINY